MAISQKTVRFARIVDKAGQPEVHTLWLPPDKDPQLKRAEKAHQVMTVAPNPTGGKTDVGIVGFDPDSSKRGAQFLIFPKSLERFAGARVVGIKFDLVAQPKLTEARTLAAPAPKRERKHARPAKVARLDLEPPLETSHGEAADVVPFEQARRSGERKEKLTQLKYDAPPKQARPAKETSTQTAARTPSLDRKLVREIRAAMKDLQRGKSVVAYQRLERIVDG
jgi:hypothetical protein